MTLYLDNRICFNTLWIYTALKRMVDSLKIFSVSIPSEFTLLSNFVVKNLINSNVSIPSEFTLLSNYSISLECFFLFQYPLNLHCSQTWFYIFLPLPQFQYPLNLHCSQTGFHTSMTMHSFNTLWIYTALKLPACCSPAQCVSIPSEFTLLSNEVVPSDQEKMFQYPLNLHCSQTYA